MSDLFVLTAGALAIIGALYAISAQQLMRGVLGLALFFAALAGIFGSIGAWYIAVGQLLLFVGGVVTLFVLAFNFTKSPALHGKGIIAALVAMAGLAVMSTFLEQGTAAEAPTLEAFGTMLFTQYGWVLNIALLLLFAGLIASQHFLEDT